MTEPLFDPTLVERFRCTTGGCGDPDCCGSYGEMDKDSDGDYVKYEDFDKLLSLYQELQSKHEPKG